MAYLGKCCEISQNARMEISQNVRRQCTTGEEPSHNIWNAISSPLMKLRSQVSTGRLCKLQHAWPSRMHAEDSQHMMR
eukprot:2166840-Pleurochrysis_carterae.AAC.1